MGSLKGGKTERNLVSLREKKVTTAVGRKNHIKKKKKKKKKSKMAGDHTTGNGPAGTLAGTLVYEKKKKKSGQGGTCTQFKPDKKRDTGHRAKKRVYNSKVGRRGYPLKRVSLQALKGRDRKTIKKKSQ